MTDQKELWFCIKFSF